MINTTCVCHLVSEYSNSLQCNGILLLRVKAKLFLVIINKINSSLVWDKIWQFESREVPSLDSKGNQNLLIFLNARVDLIKHQSKTLKFPDAKVIYSNKIMM